MPPREIGKFLRLALKGNSTVKDSYQWAFDDKDFIFHWKPFSAPNSSGKTR